MRGVVAFLYLLDCRGRVIVFEHVLVVLNGPWRLSVSIYNSLQLSPAATALNILRMSLYIFIFLKVGFLQ